MDDHQDRIDRLTAALDEIVELINPHGVLGADKVNAISIGRLRMSCRRRRPR